MTKQTHFPVAAAEAAMPDYPGTVRLSGVSAIATRLKSVTDAACEPRGWLLHHRRTCAAVQNETLVSQYFGGFPSRDMVRDMVNRPTGKRGMTRIFRWQEAGGWEPLR